MYNIEITPLAMQDLDAIVQYIMDTLSNTTAASNLLDDIEKRYEELSETPMMYEKCRDFRLMKLGYHRVVIKNYIMVYKIDEQKNNVYIMRFFYGAQDYEKLI